MRFAGLPRVAVAAAATVLMAGVAAPAAAADMVAPATVAPTATGQATATGEAIEQVAEPGATSGATSLRRRGGQPVTVAGAPDQVCHRGASWLRVRFRALNLSGGDRLTLRSSRGDTLVFAGNRWSGRTFHTRALRGDCVQVTGLLTDRGSRYEIDGYQAGSRALETADVVVAGSGDICGALCNKTADVLDTIAPQAVFTAGDNAYDSGRLTEFQQKYDPYWGRFKSMTHPAPGNHEYQTTGAAGYFDYFNGIGQITGPAGDRGKGYYSWDVGDWHFVALNSNIAMGAGSAQEQWLRQNLAANTKPCTAAYWHHPRFSRGTHGSSTAPAALWRALHDNRADVIVVGHDHNYQRYAPQTADGVADPTGPRQFVVGTGGIGLYAFNQSAPNFEVGNAATHGVLKLTLGATGYTWNFMPIAGQTFTDTGSGTCHRAGGPTTCASANLNFPSYPQLSSGATGAQVTAAQCLLENAGHKPGAGDPSGTFDAGTVAATQAFQQARSLPVTGVVDSHTWTALLSFGDTPTLRNGSTGAAVMRLQRALTAALNRTVGIDGQFGPLTEQAVRDYQSSRGLSADGIVGAQTWGALQAGK